MTLILYQLEEEVAPELEGKVFTDEARDETKQTAGDLSKPQGGSGPGAGVEGGGGLRGSRASSSPPLLTTYSNRARVIAPAFTSASTLTSASISAAGPKGSASAPAPAHPRPSVSAVAHLTDDDAAAIAAAQAQLDADAAIQAEVLAAAAAADAAIAAELGHEPEPGLGPYGTNGMQRMLMYCSLC